jgi:hypothetical protein
MKHVLFIFAALLFITSCDKEKTIKIPTLTIGKHHVLVEEATGVKCVNCPAGARLLTHLRDSLYGEENLVIVSIHTGFYVKPYPNSLYNFETTKGNDMVNNYIEEPQGFPSVAIDRHKVNDNYFLFPSDVWPGAIAAEFQKDYGLELFLNNTYEPATRTLTIKVNMAPSQTLTNENHLSVVITQDSIRDLQLDPLVSASVPSEYYHRHVFRDIITAAGGDLISEPLTAATLVTRTFTYTLPANWDEKHCNIVAFVHHSGNPDKDVLQVTEKPVIQ